MHGRVRIPDVGEALRNREYSEVCGVAVRHFVPEERRGHPSIRERSNGIGGTRGSIFGVLVVIEKYAMTLLLPPLRCRQLRHATLDLTRQRDGRTANFNEGPSLVNPRIDMHAARTAGLRPSLKTSLIEKRLHFECDTTHVFPGNAGTRIQIDAQFVRMVEITGPYGVRMEFDATKIDDP